MSKALVENYQFLARYNHWMNQRLMDACEKLTDEERKRERGAFFGSIHRTLNHLVVADQVWLRRLAATGREQGMACDALEGGVIDVPEAYRLDAVPFEDWSALRARRLQLDDAIGQWVLGMHDSYPQLTMRYSNSKGVQREHPAWKAITHFFNHQTHHRSQAITLLTQAGVDVGVTDLIALL